MVSSVLRMQSRRTENREVLAILETAFPGLFE
ncbi:MAG: hypothetical protein GY731_05340 [Gammaproteobacteria bacterium]|nr:hypothetical protein [Gammaproteobacteria bacterium]